MVFEMRMPKLGLSMVEGTVIEWLAAEGGWVEKGESLLIVETEKVQNELEALWSGYLHIVARENEVIPVGGLLGALAETEKELEEIAGEKVLAADGDGGAAKSTEEIATGEDQLLVKASPAAKRTAAELGIDLRQVEGTGPGGRIVLEDVERFFLQPEVAIIPGAPPVTEGNEDTHVSETKRAVAQEESPPARREAAPHQEKKVKRVIPLAGTRRTIARRMIQSLQTAAQMTSFNQIDVTEMDRLRLQLKEGGGEPRVKLSYSGIVAKAASIALKEQPIMNSSVVGDEIVMWEDVNIGVAVALEDGLVVPVVHQTDRLSIMEICSAIEELGGKARRRALTLEEVSGGTFTLTNIGWYGDEYGTPIINPPEVAILGIGIVSQRAVVMDGQVMPRTIMPVSLTVDHRVLDGATGGAFVRRIEELLENPVAFLSVI